MYKFFFEDVSATILLVKGPSSSQTSSRSPLPPISSQKSLMKRKRSNSGSITRTRIPSIILNKMKTNSCSSAQNLKNNISQSNDQNNISFSIAAFTVSYLLWAVIYTFINAFVRILMLFFDVDVSCNLAEYLSMIIVLYKYSLYLIFIVRLHKVFVVLNGNSDSKNMKIFAICSGIFITAGFINFLMNTLAQIKSNDGKCSNGDMSYFGPVLPAIIIDSCINLLLLFLFIQKLAIVIRSQTAILDWSNKTQLARIRSLIKIMTKLTVLVFVSVSSTWILYFTIYRFIPGGTAHIDVVIGAICVIFCYEFHDKQFNYYCYPCRQCCYNVCFWWFISGEYCFASCTICKKLYKKCKLCLEKCQECHRTQTANDNSYCLKTDVEDDYMGDDFEGGICAVCCICIVQRIYEQNSSTSTLSLYEMDKIDESNKSIVEIKGNPQLFMDDIETIKLKINQKNNKKPDEKQEIVSDVQKRSLVTVETLSYIPPSNDDGCTEENNAGIVFISESDLNPTAIAIVDHKNVDVIADTAVGAGSSDGPLIIMEKAKSFEMEIAQAADEEQEFYNRHSVSHSRRSVSRVQSVSPESKSEIEDTMDVNISENDLKNDFKNNVKIDFSCITTEDESGKPAIEHTKSGTMIIVDANDLLTSAEDDKKGVKIKLNDADVLQHMSTLPVSTQPSIQRLNTNTFSFRAMKLRQMQKMLISGDGSGNGEIMGGLDFFQNQRPSVMRKRVVFKLPQAGNIKKNRSSEI